MLGLINVVKTFAQCLSPLITGVLASRDAVGWSFVLAGALKVLYDLGILWMFAGHKPRAEVEEEEVNGAQSSADEPAGDERQGEVRS